jgi:hypothetical protein
MIVDGQDVNAAVTNAAFVSKTANSTVTGAITLAKVSGSGATVADAQAAINDGISHAAATAAHGATGAVVGTTNTQTLTNKDYDGGTASNTSRITLPKAAKTSLDALTRKQGTILFDTTSNKPYYDDGTNLQLIGSGSGGSVNLVGNPDGEAGTTGWATYADAAASRPVDGTGGTASVTWTTTSTAPLSGTSSFLFTKDAANRQGQGVSYDMSLPLQYRAKALTVSVPYIVNSGTFVAGTSSTDSDLIVYFYDITNSKLVEPSSFKFLSNSTTVSDSVQATVQFDSNCTSFRMIFHCASASASAYVLKMDTISIGPANYQYGTPVTDWQAWTPTGSWVTNTTYTGWRRRVGDTEEYRVVITTSGAPTATLLSINLPNTIDTTKLPSSTYTPILGQCKALDASISAYGLGYVGYLSTTSVFLTAPNASSTYVTAPDLTQAVPFTFGAGDSVIATFSAPILGWSSSVQTSDQTDTRVCAAILAANSATTVMATPGTEYKIALDTAIQDTHGGFSDANDRYIAQVPGYYQAFGAVTINVGSTERIQTYIKKNGTTQVGTFGAGNIDGNANAPVSGIIYLNTGDYLELWAAQDSASSKTTSAGTGVTYLHICRISGPSAIAATESVNASYGTAAAQSIPTATTTIVDFGTKNFDSHGSVTTGASWKFTAQTSGTYLINGVISYSIGSTTAVPIATLFVFKNGVQTGSGSAYNGTTTSGTFVGVTVSETLKLNAGDYIDLRAYQTTGSSKVLTAFAQENRVSVIKVGN